MSVILEGHPIALLAFIAKLCSSLSQSYTIPRIFKDFLSFLLLLKLGNKLLNAATYFIADWADSIKSMPGRVVKLPVEVAFTGEKGTSVPTSHGDYDIASLDSVGIEDLGFLIGNVDTFFAHGFDDHRIDGVGWGRAGGADFNSIASKMREVASGHL